MCSVDNIIMTIINAITDRLIFIVIRGQSSAAKFCLLQTGKAIILINITIVNSLLRRLDTRFRRRPQQHGFQVAISEVECAGVRAGVGRWGGGGGGGEGRGWWRQALLDAR